MSVVKIIVGLIGFLLVWLVVAVIVGWAVVAVFPPADKVTMIGIGLDWRNIPGTVLGFFAGIHSFLASVRKSKKPR